MTASKGPKRHRIEVPWGDIIMTAAIIVAMGVLFIIAINRPQGG